LFTIDFGVIVVGGFGSGNWDRRRCYALLEQVPELSIDHFDADHGTLTARPRDSYKANALSYSYTYLRLGETVLLFPEGGGSAPALHMAIRIDTTACHFGGVRHWLICPHKECGRRVRSLYLKDDHSIGCRKCQGLCYEIQYGGKIDLALTRLRKYQRLVGRGASNSKIDTAKMYKLFSDVLAPLEKIARGDT